MKKIFTYSALLLFTFSLFPNFTNAQYNASDLLGQLDGSNNPVFTTSTANNGGVGPNSSGFSAFLGGIVLDEVHHRLFISDVLNYRILVFNLDSSNNLIDRIADNVIGQIDFLSNATATSQNGIGIGGSQGLAYDSVHDRLFVNDVNNHRILVFETSAITNGMNASYVLGQPDFVTTTAATTQSGLSTPLGLTYDPNNNRLFTVDRTNNRILVFDVSIITNGMNASYVLGQPDFVTTTAATTQNGLNSGGRQMTYDTTNDRLFVADVNNRRILIFNVGPGLIANGMNASFVLGQSNFTSGTILGTTANSTNSAFHGLTYDEGNERLFVPDQNTGNRVLVFDLRTITNGEDAIAVLGQNDFVTGTTQTISQSSLSNPFYLDYDVNNNRLYTGGIFEPRVLIFNFVKLSTTNPSSATKDTTYSQSLSTSNSQGTVTYEVTSGSLPTGLSLNTSTGEISGTPTVVGSSNFTVQATDDNGAIGYFLSQPQEYTLTVEEPRSNSSGSRPRSRTTTYVPVVTEPSTPVYQVVELTTPSSNTLNFTRTLRIKDSGEDVKELQKYLNTHGYPVAIAGAGSLGNETTKFGLLTHSAVVKFQLANNLVGDGIVGPLTRAFLK